MSKDLTNKRFGKLVAKKLLVAKPYIKRKWLCQCDCGNICTRLESSLKSSKRDGRISSCGCENTKYLTAGDSNRCSKAGLHRKDSFVDGCNIQMTFRNGTISTNTSGVQGISWSKNANKWYVYIGYKCYRAYLGVYEHIEDAIKIRTAAEEAIKNNTFDDFYYQLRGYRLEDTHIKQVKSERRIKNDN